jgi:hypothetical protein
MKMVTMRNLLDLISISMFISMCYCDPFITEANKRIISGIQIHRDEKLCDINGGLGPSKLLNQRCLIKAADESCKFFPLVKNLTNCEQARYAISNTSKLGLHITLISNSLMKITSYNSERDDYIDSFTM